MVCLTVGSHMQVPESPRRPPTWRRLHSAEWLGLGAEPVRAVQPCAVLWYHTRNRQTVAEIDLGA